MAVARVLRSSVLACAAAFLATAAFAQQKPAPARGATPPRPSTAKPAAPAPAAAPKPAPLPPHVVVKTDYAAGDKTTTSVTSADGKRQRIEYGSEMIVISQCDTGRHTQINGEHRKFFTAAPPPVTPAPASKKGGVITYTTTVTDTGERKPMFGSTARHLTTLVIKEPGAGACDKIRERVETDGWFIDRPAALACEASEAKPPVVVTSDCADEVKYVQVGSATAAYPLSYTVKTSADNGPPTSMTMTVASLERVTLPDATFATPEGFDEVTTLADLTSGPTSDAPKVGVLAITNKTKDAVSLRTLSEALSISLVDAGLNAAMLQATTPAAALTEARGKSLDFILITQVTEISKPAKGILGKVGGSKEYGAKVDYVLTAPGGATARLTGSERSGTSTLQSAVSTARTVARYVTPFGVLSSQFKFMNTFSTLTAGAPSTTMSQSPDPVINTIFSIIGTATPKKAASDDSPQSEDAAVAGALEKEVAAVSATLVKK
jgi:hypothetical protein